MTREASSDVDRVVQLARRELVDPTKWVQPDGYPNDIEASILDAVFSSQVVLGGWLTATTTQFATRDLRVLGAASLRGRH